MSRRHRSATPALAMGRGVNGPGQNRRRHAVGEHRLATTTWALGEPGQPLLGEPLPPHPHRVAVDPQLLGDRQIRPARRSQADDPRPQDVSLCRLAPPTHSPQRGPVHLTQHRLGGSHGSATYPHWTLLSRHLRDTTLVTDRARIHVVQTCTSGRHIEGRRDHDYGRGITPASLHPQSCRGCPHRE